MIYKSKNIMRRGGLAVGYIVPRAVELGGSLEVVLLTPCRGEVLYDAFGGEECAVRRAESLPPSYASCLLWCCQGFVHNAKQIGVRKADSPPALEL